MAIIIDMGKIVTLQDAKKLAIKNNGFCLAEEYISAKTYMSWKCNKGHQWESTFDNIKNRKRWCPECAGNKRLSIKVAKQIAHSKGGKCLSSYYINVNTLMKWKCNKEHIWSATLGHVRYEKSWCPECAGNKPLTIEVAKEIAKNRGGHCLSTKYANSRQKLKWKCSFNHIWDAPLYTIKNGNHWCPECGRKNTIKNSLHSYILYHWKTGEELVCQASYEKKVVEYLNKNKIDFKWQHKVFNMTFKNGKRTTYRPDLYIIGRRKPWIEIKGYFREDAKEKWEVFNTRIKPNSELWDKSKLKEMEIL